MNPEEEDRFWGPDDDEATSIAETLENLKLDLLLTKEEIKSTCSEITRTQDQIDLLNNITKKIYQCFEDAQKKEVKG